MMNISSKRVFIISLNCHSCRFVDLLHTFLLACISSERHCSEQVKCLKENLPKLQELLSRAVAPPWKLKALLEQLCAQFDLLVSHHFRASAMTFLLHGNTPGETNSTLKIQLQRMKEVMQLLAARNCSSVCFSPLQSLIAVCI